jgi:hypothetical protein
MITTFANFMIVFIIEMQMGIGWTTGNDTATSTVQWGLGNTTNLPNAAAGFSYTYTVRNHSCDSSSCAAADNAIISFLLSVASVEWYV